ncbi:hypothetical protein [Photobacterium sanguinicancri]|uniref:SMODS and SLOG-associating 2TM effector domain-containing protein n=1 Tax=Photobacterium sanguinicancri TaxID=875932 RepID=A0AAW7YF99_9GAMM|nr:hypothetical protein [Photobacterium sanguinicancri]MDO6545493.1 hypothetical protein [Photobacterium sanguinicancri]
MTKEFFTLTEYALKLRRNLLFVSSLCVVHFGVTSLSSLKVFGVSIPDELLNVGLPLCLTWFALNYFYSLYAEFTQWKASFIVDVDVPDGMTDKSWKTRTLIPEIKQLTENSIQIHAEFSTSKSYSPGNRELLSPEKVTEDTKELLVNIENQLMSAIKTDVERILKFQKAIKQYNLANQLRLYILDTLVPFCAFFGALLVAYFIGKFI